MSAPAPYLHFPGTARDALTFYGDVFGCTVQLHTFEEFNRTDGPGHAIAHGYLVDGPVTLFASDASCDEPVFRSEGLMLSLLGASDPSTLSTWFTFYPKVAGSWMTCRCGPGAPPTGRSSTGTVSTG